ncbi:CDP-glycerol glycerophosphotransferase family protein [Alloiococcus sp. CFN-8]|uniref:CDP-glycerol glycerophosphotransferase family protein n=1 Tax=Alloiococcus sp. CFN-8 TaxID=3416081 RepID=UPI003CEAD414
MFNIVIAHKDNNQAIIKTLNRLSHQLKSLGDKIKIYIYEIDFDRELHDFLDTDVELSKRVEIISAEDMKVTECYEKSFNLIEEGYVQFMKSGSLVSPGLYRKVEELLTKEEEELSYKDIIIIPEVKKKGTALKGWKPKASRILMVEEIDYGLPYFYNSIINISLLKGRTFDSNLKHFTRDKLLLDLILQEEKYLYFKGPGIYTPDVWTRNDGSFSGASNKGWYIEGLKELLLPIMEGCNSKGKDIPRLVQGYAFNLILAQFNLNINTKDKHAFSSNKELEEYEKLCRRTLINIDDSIILNIEGKAEYTATNPLKIAFLRLKYGKDFKAQYVYSQPNKSVLLTMGEYAIADFAVQKVYIDLMEFREDKLIIEASIAGLIPKEEYSLVASLNGIEIPIEETYRYAHTKYFGVSVHKRYTFKIAIPKEEMEKRQNNKLIFSAVINNFEVPLKVEGGRYTSKIPNTVPKGYWYSNGFLIIYRKKKSGLLIQRRTVLGHIKKEINYLASLMKKKKRSATLIRVCYWLTRPWLSRKNLWITFDKMYKGGDCGEYFYKYLISTNNTSIEPHYIINYDYPDADRLIKEGYKPLRYRSLKQRLYFLNSSIVATTHANLPAFSGMIPACFSCLQDLFNAEVVCIQHGLAVQQLAHNNNQLYDNLKRFYCASPREIENLSKPIYYFPEDYLKLTGIPRFDGLKSDDKKQILITPTWRNYIAVPASLGNVRPYTETFKETDYFKIYNNLISDERLIAAAKKNGYKIIYLLHPTISSQISDYQPGEGVEVRSAVGVNYEEILKESSLMVTDYSGVQFDFAYMRKPVVYYHPPKLPPHYSEGGFFYDTMGFGEICTDHEELVSTLISYMERQCSIDSFYKKREDDFFAFEDLNSCQRIYHDLVEYQNSLNNKIQ